MMTSEQAISLIQNLDGPRLGIPIALIQKFGDLPAAAFLQQAAYLSSIKPETNFWFDLAQTGGPGADPKNLWSKLGSWESLLGLGPDAQLAARARIERVAPGLMEEKRKGVPARLFYRVLPVAYISFLTGIQIREFQESGFGESRNLDSEKSGNYS